MTRGRDDTKALTPTPCPSEAGPNASDRRLIAFIMHLQGVVNLMTQQKRAFATASGCRHYFDGMYAAGESPVAGSPTSKGLLQFEDAWSAMGRSAERRALAAGAVTGLAML